MKDTLEKIVKKQNDELNVTISRIFGASSLPDEMGKALYQAFTELANYKVEIFQTLLQNLEKEKNTIEDGRGPDRIWQIATALVPANQARVMSFHNFFPMPGWPEIDDGEEKVPVGPLTRPMFLKVPYAELENYVNREYQGALAGEPFNYRLKTWAGYCAVEKDLATLASLYGIARPLMFSPWSRRAVYIDAPQNVLEKGTVESLHLASNGLEGVLLPDQELMWNVACTAGEESDSSSLLPDERHPRAQRTYKKCNERTFILPVWDLPEISGFELLEPRRQDNEIIISSRDPLGNECKRFEVKPAESRDLPDGVRLFENECDLGVLAARERARTKGEINLVLKALSANGYKLEFAEGAGRRLVRYKRTFGHQMRNAREDERMPERVKKAVCHFSCEGPELFLADYIEYVSHYLSRRYPEYDWQGSGK